jgi:hypothetical protein
MLTYEQAQVAYEQMKLLEAAVALNGKSKAVVPTYMAYLKRTILSLQTKVCASNLGI